MGIHVRLGCRHRRGRHRLPAGERLPAQGWFDLADAVTDGRADPRPARSSWPPRAAASAPGVDIKEMQRTPGHEALLGANRGCYAAFAAVYECEVPVIAAVHGFCLGGGVGLVGNADIVIASDDATFGLPEVDRGALGAATHLARLVPQHLMRAMVYTCRTVDRAASCTASARCSRSCPATGCATAARAVAGEIAGKDPAIIRRAKESLNGIDPVDVKRSLPFRAGLHLRAQPHRRLRPRPGSLSWTVALMDRQGDDRRRGGRRAARRHDDRHRRLGLAAQADGAGAGDPALRPDRPDLVSYGGPDVGLLMAAGKRARVVCGFVSLDTIPLEPHFRRGRQEGAIELTELDEGMLYWGLLAAAHRLPFLPIRAGLGSDVMRVNPELRTVRSPYPTARSWSRCPRCKLDAALIHLNRADARGNGQYLGPDPYFDDLFCLAAAKRLRVLREAGRTPRSCAGPARCRACWSTG